MVRNRSYHYCAKCGTRVDLLPGNYVCEDCHYTTGWFNFCAVCGIAWDEPDQRIWVCDNDLAKR